MPDAFDRLVDAVTRPRGENPDDPHTVQAMQIVLHLPKNDPPKRVAALTAAARAAVLVCLDHRADQPGAWQDALTPWYTHRIRKVVRRARNSGWERAQQLAGVTVDVDGAQARAFLPTRMDAVPAELRKLQVKGTDLPADGATMADVDASQPLILIDASLQMSAGKAAAQAGHAAMLLAAAWYQRDPASALQWAADACPLSVREVSGEEFAQAAALPTAATVVDAGFTEVAPGAITALGVARRDLLPGSGHQPS
ncbi:peptidyl-tRNA hydrolase [Corynebacterium uterequi]|uniref:peptidyl-tRNA hydrolase n=1 Tax=Corynebacterium uterequi TaxID=1072256 RepID=A0A0G3HIJ8_9CORY|nr:peptidyl-tRNA hydrolase [Corynebacterium uterequi]AKK11758.1 hypothetical protein CUTER_08895 [Corynebacterium uterequi]